MKTTPEQHCGGQALDGQCGEPAEYLPLRGGGAELGLSQSAAVDLLGDAAAALQGGGLGDGEREQRRKGGGQQRSDDVAAADEQPDAQEGNGVHEDEGDRQRTAPPQQLQPFQGFVGDQPGGERDRSGAGQRPGAHSTCSWWISWTKISSRSGWTWLTETSGTPRAASWARNP